MIDVDLPVGRVLRAVPATLGLVGGVLLLAAITLGVRPVRVGPVGDSAPARCAPIASAFADAPTGPDCAPYVRRELGAAAVVGSAGGVFEVIALLIALGLTKETEPRTAVQASR